LELPPTEVYASAAMKKLLAASIVCSAVFLAFVIDPKLPGARSSVVFKVASIVLLIALVSVARVRRKLLILGLAFSAFGDLVLDVRRIGSLGPVQLFILGLFSFLVAHILYFSLFVTNRSRGTSALRLATCVALFLAAVITMSRIWPNLAEMRVPVVAYSLALTAMAISAQWSRFGARVAIGALFFFASDTMLALSLFGHPFTGSRTVVWVTYYVAQALIATGVASWAEKPSKVLAMPAR
jgi:uncharacterized membrane protein YhhN